MTPKQRQQLEVLAHENTMLHALLRLHDTARMPEQEWMHYAIVTLAKHSNQLSKAALDAAMRAPGPCIKFGELEGLS